MTDFTYTDEQWTGIKTVFRDELSLDADRIERQVTVRNTGPDFEESFTGMETLRERIEQTQCASIACTVTSAGSAREALNGCARAREPAGRHPWCVAVPFRAKTK
jgi:hypothetical protein